MNDAKTLIKKDQEYLFHHLMQHTRYLKGEPPIWVSGKGLMLTDIHGREFLDAVSGAVWCVNVGYGRDSIADAVCKQLKEMPYYALSAGNIPAIELAEKLAEVMPGARRKVYFSNSGSEANEKAFKLARMYGRMKHGPDKYKILYRYRDYHGTTLAALSATGQEERRMGFGPLVPGFVMTPEAHCYRCPFGKTYGQCHIECAREVENIILREGPSTVCAFIVEPITAGGGILEPVKEYFPMVQEICKKHHVLLIMDEVVCGWGRTGTWFGYQHFDVNPDMVTMAKGMASAYQPISATVVKDEIFDAFLNDDPNDTFHYFRDISTYGGCAGACAAALENMRIIKDEKLLDVVISMGDYLLQRLKELEALPCVGQVRGKGLFAGVELVVDKATKVPAHEQRVIEVTGEAMRQGVILGRMNRSVPGLNAVVTMAPAYVVTKEQIDRIVDTLKASIKTVFNC